MSMHGVRLRREPSKPRNQLHPVWRGVGCLFIVLTPLLSYVSAVRILAYGLTNDWPFPKWMIGAPRLPNFLLRTPSLYPIFAPLRSLTNLYALLILTAIMIAAFAGLLSLGYAILYRLFGPPRYSDVDAPPSRVKPKPYKR
jgi:hypothetical protein